MTTTQTELVATMLVPNGNAQAVLNILASKARAPYTKNEVYGWVRERYGHDHGVTMRLVERALDKLVVAGYVDELTWYVLDSGEALVRYRLKIGNPN